MAEITTDVIKALRDETKVSVMQCKKALEEAGGDVEKAKVILRKISAQASAKKADRELGAGTAAAYVHAGGQVVGAVVLSCETDFVSKNEEFMKLAKDIAMHVAAMAPQFLNRDQVRDEDTKAAKEVFMGEVANIPEGKREVALQGKIDSYLKDKVLLDQPFVKDPAVTIQGLLDNAVQKFGEKTVITRFERLSVK
ncbi:elongation factor Ts [bacterium]|nr:elongation factor Ts [bacterium]